MKINGENTQTLTFDRAAFELKILDQARLPFAVEWLSLNNLPDVCTAIRDMHVRGAPAIGAVAAYGMAIALRQGLDINEAASLLKSTRPTAVNLAWAVDRMAAVIDSVEDYANAIEKALDEAGRICFEDIAACEKIGEFGAGIIADIAKQKPGEPVNILTHCNAGWLATVDWGTALAPIYKAQAMGIDIHVWVDETRPRNQGAQLTCFELGQQGVDHTLIADNVGGLLMQQGKVDLCIVGSDRTVANGDVCNKVGTYLKALAAKDNHVPFYVALPTSTIDWSITSGEQIPIECRDENEVTQVGGILESGEKSSVRICPEDTKAYNPAFDVTPAKYVAALITEFGVFQTTEDDLSRLKNQCNEYE